MPPVYQVGPSGKGDGFILDNVSLHCLVQWISEAKPSAAPSQRGLLGNSVLLLKASLPAEPYSSFWNKSCPVNSIWRSLPGLRLVEQEHFQRICFPILWKKKKSVYTWSPLKADDAHILTQPNLLAELFLILCTLGSTEHCVCPLAPSSGTVHVSEWAPWRGVVMYSFLN